MSSQELKQMIGTRILSEANDLKRTISALASEIGIEEEQLTNIVKGDCDIEETYNVIHRMGQKYPINISDLYLDESDFSNSIRIMRVAESEASKRFFSRKDRAGERTPYYEYRDTAMSKLGPFKPEWIEELRIVEDNDPNNPDVAYNNGHFLHQITFFIGPVNFYWEVDGKKYCREMNTGDSNYITPFCPHSFTSRDKNQQALIIAVTYGGDVRRALKELYAFGREGVKQFKLGYSDYNKAIIQLIQQHMANDNMTTERLEKIAQEKGMDIDLNKIFSPDHENTIDELGGIAECLDIGLEDVLIRKYDSKDKVVVTEKTADTGYFFPETESAYYKIWSLAKSSIMPLMKGSDIEILTKEANLDNPLTTVLHSYIYNYGNTAVKFRWTSEGEAFEEDIQPGDSIYVLPNVKYAFGNSGDEHGKVFTIRVSGAVNLSTQKELSHFEDVDRIIETKCWFD